MDLEDLVLKHYRVERQGNKMIVLEDPTGNYKADSAEKVERALTTKWPIRKTDNIFVRSYGPGRPSKWWQMVRR